MTFEKPVISAFALYSCVCLLKTLALALRVSYLRVTRNIFSNPEDCKSTGDSKLRPKFDDPCLERVRRNHQNDIENIIPFVLVGAFYCLSGPAAFTAIWHFRIFTASRFFHMLAYQIPLPQPMRFLSHLAGMLVTISMAVQVILQVTSW